MKYPKIFLVLDNCFAIKRWVKPADWLELTHEIGFAFAQASTDNEIDPLFSTFDYMDDWFSEVKKSEQVTGVKVINFYTGYQTYRTIGLAHHDSRIRRKLVEGWFKPIIQRIAELQAAGIGFSFFAMPDAVLQDPAQYKERTEIIMDLLGELAGYAYLNHEVQVSFEQMYAPQQPPWTIAQSRHYLESCYAIRKKPVYITLDVGHMVGQRKFLKPSMQAIIDSIQEEHPDGVAPSIWLGSDSAYRLWSTAREKCKTQSEIELVAAAIISEMETYPYLFAEEKDGDIFQWVEELACYSPIIHLQQTNGVHSSHAAFTPATNKDGVVTGEKLLQAIALSYQKQAKVGMPDPVENIYLSFEIFASNTETKHEIIWKLKQTLDYWRKFVPKDGLSLDKLL